MSVLHFMRPGVVALAVLIIACRPAPQPEPPRVDPPTPTSPSAEGPLVAALTVSWSHACAVERDGGLRCWGIDGVMMAGLAEIDEVDLARTVDVPPVRTAVATALADCVALRTGGVRCWGSRNGQSFNGVVEGLEDIVSLAGGSWVCAGDGHLDVRCFEPGSPTPPILRARAAVDFDAHRDRGCAVERDGKLSCWVADQPAFELGVTAGVAQVEVGGKHVCVVDERTRELSCAPTFDFGEHPLEFERLDVGAEVGSLALGHSHGCFVSEDGSTRCFGGNGWGQLGLGHTQPYAGVAVHLPGLTTSVAVSEHASCAADRDGEIHCWGQWGRGFVNGRVDHLDEVVAIGAGGNISCAERKDHGVLCWGTRHRSELDGDLGGIVAAATPTPITLALDGLRSLHPMCFLDRAKVLRCGFFGGAPDDQYGNETLFGDPVFTLKSERSGVLDHDQRWASYSLLESGRKREVECSTPEQPKLFVPKLRRPFAIALEQDLACAAEERGPISCWNLRDETTFDVPGLSDAIDLQSDGNQFCALLRSGDVHCWAPEYGANPKQLALSGLVRFAGNRFRACGIQTNRQLTCIEAKSGEMSIDPIPDVVELVAGADHHCLRTADERMTCFGSNQFGQLGALPPNIWLTPQMIE